MLRWLKWILLVIASLVLVVGIYYFLTNKYSYTNLPENEKPVLELPIDKNGKMPDTIMPMGETINHDAKYGGHPGIDFQWQDGDGVKIYASMNAEITGIFKDKNTGMYDLATRNGKWSVDYTELESVNPLLKVGSQIKVGDWVAIPNHPQKNDMNPKYRMIHWQFGYADTIFHNTARVRLCPLTYFSLSARTLIERLWAETKWAEMKANAPEICSNYYKGRDK